MHHKTGHAGLLGTIKFENRKKAPVRNSRRCVAWNRELDSLMRDRGELNGVYHGYFEPLAG